MIAGMAIPLLESYILGTIAILAGLSFALPNRMPIVIKISTGILFLILGCIYLWMTFVPMTEAQKMPIIRANIGAIAICILLSNVVSYIVDYFTKRATIKAGLPLRRGQHDSR